MTPITIAVVGSRDICGQARAIEKLLRDHPAYPNIRVISGGARGVDTDAKAAAFRARLPFQVYSAQWDAHGKAAGAIRNSVMASVADEVVALQRAKETPGTTNMIRQAQRLGKPVTRVLVAP